MKEIKWPYSEETKAIIEEIEKIEDISALSKEDRMKYDGYIKIYRDNQAILNGQWKLGYEEGIKIARRITCKKMKALGFTTEIIMRATELSLEEIEELLQQE